MHRDREWEQLRAVNVTSRSALSCWGQSGQMHVMPRGRVDHNLDFHLLKDGEKVATIKHCEDEQRMLFRTDALLEELRHGDYLGLGLTEGIIVACCYMQEGSVVNVHGIWGAIPIAEDLPYLEDALGTLKQQWEQSDKLMTSPLSFTLSRATELVKMLQKK